MVEWWMPITIPDHFKMVYLIHMKFKNIFGIEAFLLYGLNKESLKEIIWLEKYLIR